MYYDEEKTRKRKKSGSGKLLLVVILSAVLVVGALAIFLNLDKLKYYIEHGEMPDPNATSTSVPVAVATNIPTAIPEPVNPVNPEQMTIASRFNPPQGYERMSVEAGSFGEFLRNYPLRSYGTPAKLADGTENPNAPTEGVFDQDIRKNGLQQCADAIIRLYAEYRYQRSEYDYISFDCYTTPVFTLDFNTWTTGQRVRANGRALEWYASDKATPGDVSMSTFLYYLDNVFLYANTYSLKNQMMEISSADLRIGDCLIITADQTGGTDGHAIIVVDVAVNTATGEKVFILAEGNTPSTETYILKDKENDTVWFKLNEDGTFTKWAVDGSRKVTYPLDAFRRFKR
ncbi:MAG: hypothetical protein J6V14_05170 [Clostridia bacterium]|nr:hypothetical protein [Clostridia bacterium]